GVQLRSIVILDHDILEGLWGLDIGGRFRGLRVTGSFRRLGDLWGRLGVVYRGRGQRDVLWRGRDCALRGWRGERNPYRFQWDLGYRIRGWGRGRWQFPARQLR